MRFRLAYVGGFVSHAADVWTIVATFPTTVPQENSFQSGVVLLPPLRTSALPTAEPPTATASAHPTQSLRCIRLLHLMSSHERSREAQPRTGECITPTRTAPPQQWLCHDGSHHGGGYASGGAAGLLSAYARSLVRRGETGDARFGVEDSSTAADGQELSSC